MKNELRDKLNIIVDELKDDVKFLHIFSKKPEGTLARLYQAAIQVGVLLDAEEIKDIEMPKNSPIIETFIKTGSLVKIRPCGEEYKNKTYLGFYLGDIANGSSFTVHEDKIQLNFSGHNPAIFIPEIGKIVFGYESWWDEIKDESELSEITNSDIQNVWYVKLLKMMQEKDGGKEDA